MGKTCGEDTLQDTFIINGLTKRELFAILIAMGKEANSIPGSHHSPNVLVKEAVEVADLLIKELNK